MKRSASHHKDLESLVAAAAMQLLMDMHIEEAHLPVFWWPLLLIHHKCSVAGCWYPLHQHGARHAYNQAEVKLDSGRVQGCLGKMESKDHPFSYTRAQYRIAGQRTKVKHERRRPRQVEPEMLPKSVCAFYFAAGEGGHEIAWGNVLDDLCRRTTFR